MAILSISEAARTAKIARSTIQRAIKDGRLSTATQPDGSKGIDTSELFRVFGEPTESEASRAVEQAGASRQVEADERAIERLEDQIELLQRELVAARDRESWFRTRIETLDQRLLPPPKKGLLERLIEAFRRR